MVEGTWTARSSSKTTVQMKGRAFVLILAVVSQGKAGSAK